MLLITTEKGLGIDKANQYLKYRSSKSSEGNVEDKPKVTLIRFSVKDFSVDLPIVIDSDSCVLGVRGFVPVWYKVGSGLFMQDLKKTLKSGSCKADNVTF